MDLVLFDLEVRTDDLEASQCMADGVDDTFGDRNPLACFVVELRVVQGDRRAVNHHCRHDARQRFGEVRDGEAYAVAGESLVREVQVRWVCQKIMCSYLPMSTIPMSRSRWPLHGGCLRSLAVNETGAGDGDSGELGPHSMLSASSGVRISSKSDMSDIDSLERSSIIEV